MIVVDTDIIAYLLIDGEFTEAVQRLRIDETEWIAPKLWLDEFINVLATSERRSLISSELADSTLNLACETMEGRSYDIPAQRTLSVARRTGCSAYDSQYVCLAEDLGLSLYTYDRGILSKCPNVAVKPPV